MKKLFLLISFFSTISLYTQNDMNSWPDIYNDNSRTYWEIKNAFSIWLSTNSNDNIFLDTIHKTRNYKKFRRFEALHEAKLDSNGTFNTYQKEMMSYLEEQSNKSSTHCF